MKKKYLWIAVTADKYELPVAVADTSIELAKMCNVGVNTIQCCAWRAERGAKSRYRKVKVEEW